MAVFVFGPLEINITNGVRSYENNGNPSPDRHGGVNLADWLNRSLTVAARYRIFMPCGAAPGGMSGSPENPP